MRSVSRWTSVVILWLSLVGGFLTARVVVFAMDQKEHRTSVDASISPLLTTSTTPTAHSEPVVATTTMTPALPPAQFGNRFVFLPLIVRAPQFQPQPPTPTPPPSTSLLSISCDNGVCQFNNAGAFLGNRPAQDWNQKEPGTALDPENPDPANPNYFPFLCRVQGNELNCPNTQNEEQLPGIWPAVVVVLSDQVFDKERYAPGEAAPDDETKCNIRRVFVSSGRQYIFRYLKQASQRDIPIIVRLTSPGNFQDSVIDNEEDLDNPEYEHRILLGAGEPPLKADGITRRTYCDEDGFRDGRNNLPGYLSFRDVDELLDEMEQIIIFLQTDHPDFDISNLYFIPANEPNGEWYGGTWPPGSDLDNDIQADRRQAWSDMNAYFVSLYDYAQNQGYDNTKPRILTPPMGPGNFAEAHIPGSGCARFVLSDETQGGYLVMLETGTESMLHPDKNDGYTWNNYWEPGNWADDNPNNNWEQWGETCDGEAGPPQPPEKYHYHVFQFFPFQMRLNVRDASPDEETELAIITEADVFSPYQYGSLDQSPIQSKDTNNGLTASDSIHDFVVAETEFDPQHGADYIALWNLTVDHSPDASVVEPDFTTCTEMNPANSSFDEGAGRAHHELQWHMGYLVEGEVCAWFDWAWRATSPRAPGASWAAVETTP